MSGRALTVLLLTLVTAALALRSAHAEDASGLSATLTLESDYRLRGVSLNDLSPLPQLEIDWNGPDGWTLSNIDSRVDFRDHENTSVEVDFITGKKFDFAGTTINLQAFYYSYPNHDRSRGGPMYSLFEGVATVSHTWDRFTANGTLAYSPDYFAQSGVAWYSALGASYKITDDLSASGNVGHQSIHEWDAIGMSGFPYVHWDLGLTATRGPFALDVRYITTTLNGRQCALTEGGANWCHGALVAALSYTYGGE
jgi:uncharacterized protein (TIGR02001 family)